MCGGVEYVDQGKTVRVYFPYPDARLPVRTRDGGLELIRWGRRKDQTGYSPQGGWARLDSIHKGVWDKYHPTPVKIAIQRFMEKDKAGDSHWFDIGPNQFIQGLLIHQQHDPIVYVVTVKPEQGDAIHDRWPRILTTGQDDRQHD